MNDIEINQKPVVVAATNDQPVSRFCDLLVKLQRHVRHMGRGKGADTRNDMAIVDRSHTRVNHNGDH